MKKSEKCENEVTKIGNSENKVRKVTNFWKNVTKSCEKNCEKKWQKVEKK